MRMLFFVSLFVTVLLSTEKLSANTFKVGVSHSMSYFDTEPFAQAFLESIYKPLGIDVSMEYYPTGEGLVLLERGNLDADFSRFPSVVEGYENALQVPTPINHVKFYYFCLTKADCDENKVTLVPTNLLKAKTFCRDNHLNCKFLRTDRTSVFNMLTKKRNATLISSMFSSDICHTNIHKIYRKEIPELSQAQYHYIHKKHEKLLNQIDLQLQKPKTLKMLDNIRNDLLTKIWSCGIDIIDID